MTAFNYATFGLGEHGSDPRPSFFPTCFVSLFIFLYLSALLLTNTVMEAISNQMTHQRWFRSLVDRARQLEGYEKSGRPIPNSFSARNVHALKLTSLSSRP